MDDHLLLKTLRDKVADKEVLILAPGSSAIEKYDEISGYIAAERPIVFTANYLSDKYDVDYAFFSNAMRYEAVKEKEYTGEVLITSNLLDVCEEKNVLNYADLCFDEKGKCDNCVIMILKLLLKLGVKRVHLAGFDGYHSDGNNYIDSYMVSQHTKGHEENVRNRMYIADIRKQMELCFLTESLYDK